MIKRCSDYRICKTQIQIAASVHPLGEGGWGGEIGKKRKRIHLPTVISKSYKALVGSNNYCNIERHWNQHKREPQKCTHEATQNTLEADLWEKQLTSNENISRTRQASLPDKSLIKLFPCQNPLVQQLQYPKLVRYQYLFFYKCKTPSFLVWVLHARMKAGLFKSGVTEPVPLKSEKMHFPSHYYNCKHHLLKPSHYGPHNHDLLKLKYLSETFSTG